MNKRAVKNKRPIKVTKNTSSKIEMRTEMPITIDSQISKMVETSNLMIISSITGKSSNAVSLLRSRDLNNVLEYECKAEENCNKNLSPLKQD